MSDTRPTERPPQPTPLEEVWRASDERLAKHEEVLEQIARDLRLLVSSSVRTERTIDELATLLRGQREEHVAMVKRVEQLEQRGHGWSNGG